MLNFLSESEHAEEAKHKKADNPKPPEPATPDYAAGLTPVTQPSKVSIDCKTLKTSGCKSTVDSLEKRHNKKPNPRNSIYFS